MVTKKGRDLRRIFGFVERWNEARERPKADEAHHQRDRPRPGQNTLRSYIQRLRLSGHFFSPWKPKIQLKDIALETEKTILKNVSISWKQLGILTLDPWPRSARLS
jgi:hypothetical protein